MYSEDWIQFCYILSEEATLWLILFYYFYLILQIQSQFDISSGMAFQPSEKV